MLTQKRQEKSMSQEELAKNLYVSRQTISKWEKGESLPDIEKLKK
ncbi:helix-turn-helix transcriptional regulator [Vagococcus carniphilus]